MRGLRVVAAGCAIAASSGCILFTDLGGFDSQASTIADGATPTDVVLVPSEGGPEPDGASSQQEGGPTLAPYPAAVMEDKPIGYWRLDDPVAPTAKDFSGNARDGTYKGGVALGTAGATADSNGAAQFDGADDRFEAALPAAFDFAGKATFSVEAWVKRSANCDGVLSKGKYDGTKYLGWYLVYNSNMTTLQFFRAGSSAVTTTAPANDAFAHVVATFDGITLILYVNGAQAATSTTQNDLTAVSEPLVMGAATGWGNYRGVIDEVAIYDKPLSPARVKAHFDAAKLK